VKVSHGKVRIPEAHASPGDAREEIPIKMCFCEVIR
jgi:hypothetical protein